MLIIGSWIYTLPADAPDVLGCTTGTDSDGSGANQVAGVVAIINGSFFFLYLILLA